MPTLPVVFNNPIHHAPLWIVNKPKSLFGEIYYLHYFSPRAGLQLPTSWGGNFCREGEGGWLCLDFISVLYFTPNLCRDRCWNKCTVNGRSFQSLSFFMSLFMSTQHIRALIRVRFKFSFFFLTNSKFTKICGAEMTHKYQSHLASTF